MSTVNSRIESLSPEKIALLAERLRAKGEGRRQPAGIPRRSDPSHHVLSFAQQRLWFLQRLDPQSAFYSIPAAVRFRGALDIPALERALEMVMTRHEVLRSRFETQNGAPLLAIRPPAPFPIPCVDLSRVGEEKGEAEMLALARAEVARPFSLEDDLLVRATLFREMEDRHVFLLVVHHIVADGWSMGILVRELIHLYQAFCTGTSAALPDLPLQYADYAAWQVSWLETEAAANRLEEWKQRLAGMPQVLELPLDSSRPPVQTFRGRQVRFRVPPRVAEGIRSLAHQEGATPFMAFLAAFDILLGRISGQEEFGVGVPVAQRNTAQTEGIVGFFVNTLVLRTSLQGHPTYREMLRRVREAALAAYDNQDIPFEKIVDVLDDRRDISHTPLFQAMFDLQRSPLTTMTIGGTVVEPLELEIQTSKTDLLLMLQEEDDAVSGYFEYNCDLFSAASAEGWVEVFLCLLEEVVKQPDLRLSDLAALPGRQRWLLLEEWNDTAREIPALPLAVLFEQQVTRTPLAIALEYDGDRRSYDELNRQANRLAWRLRELDVGPDSLVGLFTARSAEMVVGILAIVKAGGAYLPMDIDYPKDRLSFMASDAHVQVILTQKRYQSGLPATGARVICIDEEPVSGQGEWAAAPPSLASPDHLAYVVYTSGSTGVPKGVSVTQRAVVRLVFNTNYISIEPSDRIAQASTVTFDAATFEIWGALLHGARLVGVSKDVALSPARMASLIRAGEINTLFATTALFNHVASEMPDAYLGLRTLLVGGDAAEPGAFRAILAGGPPGRLLNAYGPTECTTFATWYPVHSLEPNARSVPIGTPLSNTTAYVLDESMRPVPIGVIGELYLGGAGVAREYLNRPDLTAEKFVPDPFARRGGERLYRTGDRVRFLPGGDIEFIGRRDFQVKIHGFRIEPGEVESVVAQHPDVRQVSVVVREDTPGAKRLVAYLVARDGRILDVEQIQGYLREKLPQYMVPSAFVTLAEIPLNANGKVNRALLPPPDDLQMRSGAASTPPSTPLEKYLADHWKQVLGIETIGVHENFFYLGGDSMKGAVLINRVQKDLGESAPVSAIFLAPTIAQLAMYMNVYFPEAVKKRLGVETTSVDEYRDRVVNGWSEGRVTAETFVKFRQLIPPLQPRTGAVTRREKNRRAVFVLSPPRTGSTLFRVMLAGHPRLFAPPELELLSFNTLQERKAVLSETYSLWLEATVRALMEVEQCDAQQAQAIMEQCERDNLSIKEFYRFLQDRLGDRLLVDKTPSYPLDPAILRRAEEDFDEPLYIHLTRHPYAMVYSFIEAKLDQNFFRHKHPFTRRQLGELIWTQSNRNILDFLAEIPPRRQYRLKFEEVLREPVAEMKRVAEFLGIEYDPRLVEPYKGERMTDGVTSRSQMVGDFKFYLRKSIDQRSVDRWKIFHAEEFLSEESWAVAELLGYDRPVAGEPSPPGSAATHVHTELAAIPRVRREGPLPLSSAQLRLWFLEQLEPGTTLYNIPAAVRLRGKLDIKALQKALNEIVRRHEALRTIFRSVGGQPAQVILERTEIELPVTQVLPGSEEDEEVALQQLVRKAARIPFDISSEVPFRASLLRVRHDDHVLVLSMHHIASDGWSVGILIRELAELYNAFSGGADSRLPDLPVQFADYAAWQRGRLEKGELAGQLEYWKGQLSGATTVLELPTDRPRPLVQTLNGARESCMISTEDLRRIHGLGEAEGATPFMTLFGSFAVLLHRYTGQEDICVGTPVANRTRAEIEPLIGFFVNTLVLRADLSGNPTFRTLLGRVRDICKGAFDNQEAPFEKVVDAVQPGRDLSRSALFQVMFSYVRSGISDAVIPGLTLRGMEVESGTSKFELTLEVTETPRGLACVFEYNSGLFDRATVRRMILHFQTLLQAMLGHADRRIGDYPVIPEEEEKFLLCELNGEEAPLPSVQTFHELFEVQAAKSSDAPAVEYLGSVLTYGELNRRANQLARVLRRSGVGPECLCGLCMERSVEMIVGILGVLKAGGAYVAMDPTNPRERLQMIAEDSGPRVVLTLASSAPSVPAGPWTVVTLDADWPVIASEEEGNLPGVSLPENLAYLIYTSGSTGRPKAVMVSHRSTVNLWRGLEHMVYAHHAGRPLRTSLNAPLIFDASVQELVTLLSGHCLCIVPQEIRGDGPGLVSFFRAQKLDVVDCVPSQLKLMLTAGLLANDAPWVPEVLLPGGEAIDEETWRTVSSSPATDAYNMYGPTECTVDSTICRVRDLPSQPSIGRPIRNVQHYVLDARLCPVPIGVAGELFIGGEGLARGYFNRPDLTAERFLPNPFAARAGERMYRTGDRVKYLPDGHLIYLERLDHQVKVRGFRIELGEIEVALGKHPNVRQAAVVAQEESGGEKRLVAYYVPADGEITAGEMRKHLKATLPEHMIPVFFVAMTSLPLTPSGKLDRRALPKPDPVKLLSGLEAIAPRTPDETTLAEIWKEVLRMPEVGVRDNFFELGGDSILSIQVIARANEAGLRLTPRQLFQNPTIEALALAAGSGRTVAVDQRPVTGSVPLTPVQRQFFEEIRDDPDHWNQAVLLGIDGSLDGAVMREVVRRALVHHDALRMRFRRDGDVWVQWNDPPGADPPYEEVDLSGEPVPEGRLREHAATVQRSLSLHEGPLLRVVRYLMPGGDRLLIVIHHLVVDGVSWRILLEDLRRLYALLRQQLPAELPPKTTSFREWATRLEGFAQTDALRGELEYWRAELAAPEDPLPVDYVGGENREDSCAWVEAEFSEEESAGLTGEGGKALNATISELLLTGLLRAYERWAGKRVLRIEMEGHGREEFQDGLDVTRTVGWFTTLFPVSFDIRGAVGPQEELVAVKNQLRRVPGNGFGYGLLRYLSDDESVRTTMRSLGRAEVSFNYLGHFDRAAAPDGFRVIGEAVGQERSGRSRRSYLLDLSAKVMGGRLQLGLAYSRNHHRSETAETLLRTWGEEVRHVMRQCGASRRGEGVSADGTETGLSSTELQGIIQELNVNLDDE